MLDLLLKLLDALRELIRERNQMDARVFDRLITPTFEIAERVVQNYLLLFDRICTMAKEGATSEEIARFLELGRTEYLPARMRLRATINPYRRKYYDTKEDQFVRGLRGVLCGGLSSYEEHQLGLDYAPTAHTILDILYNLEHRGDRGPLPLIVCQLANQQREAVQTAWRDMISAYTTMQSEIARSG